MNHFSPQNADWYVGELSCSYLDCGRTWWKVLSHTKRNRNRDFGREELDTVGMSLLILRTYRVLKSWSWSCRRLWLLFIPEVHWLTAPDTPCWHLHESAHVTVCGYMWLNALFVDAFQCCTRKCRKITFSIFGLVFANVLDILVGWFCAIGLFTVLIAAFMLFTKNI